MPWHLPEDLAYFKRTTMGHTVVMGRKTFESIGRPLPGRTNVVITRNLDFRAPAEVKVFHSLPEAIAVYPDSFVIGGAEIYRQALPLANELYITYIDAEYEGDVQFPRFDPAEWHEVSSEKLGISTTAFVYRRG